MDPLTDAASAPRLGTRSRDFTRSEIDSYENLPRGRPKCQKLNWLEPLRAHQVAQTHQVMAGVRVVKALEAHGLKTPRAAAVAGILFSVLLLSSLALLLASVQVRSTGFGEWLGEGSSKVALALNLIPFAGIAFLWFIGVLRDRLGASEDKLFATVFLGVASCSSAYSSYRPPRSARP